MVFLVMESRYPSKFTQAANRDMLALSCPPGNTFEYCAHFSKSQQNYVDYIQDYLNTISVAQYIFSDIFLDLEIKYDFVSYIDQFKVAQWLPYLLLLLISCLPTYLYVKKI